MEPKTKKFLLGCGIGCGGLLVLVLAAFVSFFVWLRQPGELLEPGRLVGEDTIGYAEWTLRLEDPGTERFVEDLLDGFQRNQQDALDELEGGPLAMLGQWQQRRDRKKFRELFPIVAAWTLTRGEDPERPHHLLSVSLEKMGNSLVLSDWILGFVIRRAADEDIVALTHQDETLFELQDGLKGLTFFLRGNDIFFTYDADTARDAVDRLQPQVAEARPPTDVDALFARLPEDRPFRAVMTNGNGEIYQTWERFALAPDDPGTLRSTAAELTGLTVSGGLSGDESFEGEIALRCPDPSWAESYADVALTRFREGLAYEDLEIGADVTVDGEWIRISFRLEGALSPLWNLLERAGGVVTLPDGVGD